MEMFKDIDVSMWAKVSVPLLAATMLLALTVGLLAVRGARKRTQRLLRRLHQENFDQGWDADGMEAGTISWLYGWVSGRLDSVAGLVWRREDKNGWGINRALSDMARGLRGGFEKTQGLGEDVEKGHMNSPTP